MPYTSEVDRALCPHIAVLTQLMNNADTVDANLCPAQLWQMGQKLSTKAIEHRGGLYDNDLAAINNWYNSVIPGASENQHK